MCHSSETVEGNPGDRTASGLYTWHNGDTLIQDAAKAYSTVIVVIHTVGPLILENWISLPSVKAVLFAHLPGQEAGSSLTDILFGSYSPSGHLPYSIPTSESSYPASVGIATSTLGQVQDTFSEGLYIDYRYLNAHNITPRYPFGYGLSYTNFTYTNASLNTLLPISSIQGPPLTRPAKGPTPSYPASIPPASEVAYPPGFVPIDRYLYPYLADPYSITNSTLYPYPTGYSTVPKPGPPAGGGLGGNDALWDPVLNVTVLVWNTGSYVGKAVAQLYVQYPNDIAYDAPVIQLRDFTKVLLQPGEKQNVTLGVTRKDLSVWDVESQNWVVPESAQPYKLWVGASSGELWLVCTTDGKGCVEGVESPVATLF